MHGTLLMEGSAGLADPALEHELGEALAGARHVLAELSHRGSARHFPGADASWVGPARWAFDLAAAVLDAELSAAHHALQLATDLLVAATVEARNHG